MFPAATFAIVKTWKQPRCPSVGDGRSDCGPSRQWNIIQHQTEVSHQAVKRHRNLNAHDREREASLEGRAYDPSSVTFWRRRNRGASEAVQSSRVGQRAQVDGHGTDGNGSDDALCTP